MSFSVKISGLESIVAKIQKKSDEMEKKVQAELNQFGIEAREEAVRRAPVDEGHLKRNINFKKERLKISIVVAAHYAAYIEFGTRKRVDIPAGWEDFAAQFKGKSGRGDYFDFLNSILDWVKRKGLASTYSTGVVKNQGGKKSGYSLDVSKGMRKSTKSSDLERVAQAIAYSIIRNGIKPHPFFIPAVNHARVALENRLKNIKL